jgi:UrcA family protein
MRSLKKVVFGALAAIALTGVAAAAEPAQNTRAHTVRFDIEALADPIAVDALHRNLVRAAQRLCGDGQLATTAGRRNRCVTRAVDAAIARADVPPLSVLHANLRGTAKYRSWRRAPDEVIMAQVAAAYDLNTAEGPGKGGGAGEIFQPPQR